MQLLHWNLFCSDFILPGAVSDVSLVLVSYHTALILHRLSYRSFSPAPLSSQPCSVSYLDIPSHSISIINTRDFLKFLKPFLVLSSNKLINYQDLLWLHLQFHDDLLWHKEFGDTKRGHWVFTDTNLLPGKRHNTKTPSLLNLDFAWLLSFEVQHFDILFLFFFFSWRLYSI